MSDLIIEVEEIRGGCPVYKKGDRMVFRGGFSLDLGESDALCSHTMGSLLPFMQSLGRGVPPSELGLAKDGPTKDDPHVGTWVDLCVQWLEEMGWEQK